MWKLLVSELWENDESGLILTNKEDVRNSLIPLWQVG
jgi:hypothetical protein